MQTFQTRVCKWACTSQSCLSTRCVCDALGHTSHFSASAQPSVSMATVTFFPCDPLAWIHAPNPPCLTVALLLWVGVYALDGLNPGGCVVTQLTILCRFRQSYHAHGTSMSATILSLAAHARLILEFNALLYVAFHLDGSRVHLLPCHCHSLFPTLPPNPR